MGADFNAPLGVVEQASSLLMDVEATISAVPTESILTGSQDGYPQRTPPRRIERVFVARRRPAGVEVLRQWRNPR
jgi:hypothetical protein